MKTGKSYLKYLLFMWILCLGLILVGCATGKKPAPAPVDPLEQWQLLAKRSSEPAAILSDIPRSPDKLAPKDPVPPEPGPKPFVVYDLLPPDEPSAHVPTSVRKLPDLPVTMHMNDVSVPVLLRTLAKIADLNMMINDGITGQTQLVVKNTPWNQVFLGLLDAYGLACEWTGEILQVFSAADFKRRQTLLEARSDYENARTRQTLARLQLEREKMRQEPLTTRIVKIRYASLDDLHQNLNQYLSATRIEKTASLEISSAALLPMTDGLSGAETRTRPAEKGSIMKDSTSNALIIHASQSDIDQLLPVIEQLDQPAKQILIEAHIVEVESNTGKALGIQWGGLVSSRTSRDKQISVGGGISPFEGPLKDGEFYNPVDGNVVNLPMAGELGLNLGIMAQKMGSFVLYTQLMALQEEGVLNILSKPSITTQNHQKAIIKSGKEVPYQTRETSTSGRDTFSIEWKEAVISLEVTPHIIDDAILRLEIITQKDEIDFTTSVNGNPTVIKKEAHTSVLLLDGQTTVIAGLNKEKKTDSEQGVPGLKDIPGLGWLFKSKEKAKEKEELLIFITPHILDNPFIRPAEKG